MNRRMVLPFVFLSCMAHGGGDIPSASGAAWTHDINKKDFYIFAGGGVSFFGEEIKPREDTSFVRGALDDKSAAFEVGIGYNFTKNVFAEFAYQRAALDIANIDSGYISLNYQFSGMSLNPYIGILGGYSKLKWTKRPHRMLKNEKLTSKSSFYGLQTGIRFPISDNVSFTAKYQYIKLDHLIDIRNGAGSIEHNSVQNLLVGVEYGF